VIGDAQIKTESRKPWIIGLILMTCGVAITALASLLYAFRTTCHCPAGETCMCPSLTPSILYLIPLAIVVLLLVLGAGIALRYYGS
jgi:hypothetical protein